MPIATQSETKTKKSISSKLDKLIATTKEPLFIRIGIKKVSQNAAPARVVKHPESDATHIFNQAALDALRHTMQAYALKVSDGEWICTFPHMEDFTKEKKIYQQLSRSLKQVRVWTDGPQPEGCKKIDFIPPLHKELKRYTVALFSSSKGKAVLVARQLNTAKDPAKQYYTGFFSFNPFLVDCIRSSFYLTSSGLNSTIRHWQTSHHMPKVSLQDLRQFLQTHQKSASAAKKTITRAIKSRRYSIASKRHVM